MKTAEVLECASTRFRRQGAWGALLLFAGLWNALRWVMGPERLDLGEFLIPFMLGVLVLGLSALPWQWTGDDRRVAPFIRGLAQALPWNALLLLLLLPLLPVHAGRGGRGGGITPVFPNFPPRLMVLMIASGAFSLLAGWIIADRDQEALKAESQRKLAREAQSRALQAQMNPHVLFNTIGGLAELARENGVAAEAALVDLAGLLRLLLNHTSQTRVSLGDERSLVEGFLSLERFRLGDRLSVSWAWDERLEDTEVPPLLLQPLVENALKHGIVPNRDGGTLEIGLSGELHRIRLWVANTGLPLKAGEKKGTGLGNLRQRLELMDVWQGKLDLRSEGDRTVVELILEPCHG